VKFPEDLKYTKRDEWVRVEGEECVIGVSDFAQDQLSDIVYLEVSLEIGGAAKKGDIFGTVESVKAASDIYLPVSGEVVEINETLLDNPETINHDPYGAGWIIKLRMSDVKELEELLDSKTYEADTKERG